MSTLKESLTSVGKTVWWLLLLRGIFAIIFGILALANPFGAAIALAIVFGAYIFVDGVISIVGAFTNRVPGSGWGWHLVWGIISVIAGIAVMATPGLATLVGLYVVAFWAIALGAAQIFGAFSFRKESGGQSLWLILSGLISVVFGIVILAMNPAAGLYGIMTTIGFFMIAFGVVMVILAFQARADAKKVGAV